MIWKLPYTRCKARHAGYKDKWKVVPALRHSRVRDAHSTIRSVLWPWPSYPVIATGSKVPNPDWMEGVLEDFQAEGTARLGWKTRVRQPDVRTELKEDMPGKRAVFTNILKVWVQILGAGGMCGDEGKDEAGKEGRGQIMKGLPCQGKGYDCISKTVGNYWIIYSRKIARSCVKIY